MSEVNGLPYMISNGDLIGFVTASEDYNIRGPCESDLFLDSVSSNELDFGFLPFLDLSPQIFSVASDASEGVHDASLGHIKL